MRTVSLLQIGDIHYPDWNVDPYETDNKDEKINPQIKAGVSFVPLRSVLSKLASLTNEPSIEAVAFMGDFTSRGKLDQFRAAIQHMSWLCKVKRDLSSRPALVFSPGNHDVAREEALTLGQLAKFDTIRRFADEALFYRPPIDGHIHIKLGGPSSGKVHLFAINTTLGSWERYMLPPALQEVVRSEGVADAVTPPDETAKLPIAPAGAGKPLESSSYYDQLDTPYVSAKSLQELGDAISRISGDDVVVIIGHHNLLPQEQPRLSPYAELLNSGYLRRFLISLGRPIVYLHGHTHNDILEEVTDPKFTRARVIAISAPKIEQGFNEITFHFDGRLSALGIRVLPWRVSPSRGRFAAMSADQTACTLQNGTAVEPAFESRMLYNSLEAGQRFNIRDIEEKINQERIDLKGRDIENVLLELFFWRWIEIERSSSPSTEWIIFGSRARSRQ